MQQTLSTNVVIEIPADQVIVSRKEYEELRSNELLGTLWTFDELRDHLQRKATWWVTQEILLKYRDILDVENGGWVIYPRAKGVAWRIGALKMANWLEENWTRFDWDAKKDVD